MGFSVDKNIYPVICFVSLFQYNKHEASGSQPAVSSRSLHGAVAASSLSAGRERCPACTSQQLATVRFLPVRTPREKYGTSRQKNRPTKAKLNHVNVPLFHVFNLSPPPNTALHVCCAGSVGGREIKTAGHVCREVTP